jgi:phosphoserine phosphatase
VDEVSVVDDGSVDDTADLARAAGARVITSTLLGKGASMEDGLWAARNEVLLYLDGDLSGLHPGLVRRMTRPILDGEADFVKAKFSRRAGRVTILTARPLLRLFFPELAHFDQPLGGIIAARRSLLRQLRFENDYGVDIGLFLDAAATGARLAEVDIGAVEHDSHPLEGLADMAAQVARALLDRAARYGRLSASQVREAAEAERYARSDFGAVLDKVGRAERLALFDMDGTLLAGRYVVSLAMRTNQTAALSTLLDNPELPADERTRRIAGLFAGVPLSTFEETARHAPLTPGASEAVVGLRRAGYRVGIVTDGFHVGAESVRRRVFADFSIAHRLGFRDGKATGEVALSRAMAHPRGCPLHPHCKVNAMLHLIDRMGIDSRQVLAVGDGENDVCLLRAAGQSVAFEPKTHRVLAAAGCVLHGSLSDLLATVTGQGPRRSAG